MLVRGKTSVLQLDATRTQGDAVFIRDGQVTIARLHGMVRD